MSGREVNKVAFEFPKSFRIPSEDFGNGHLKIQDHNERVGRIWTRSAARPTERKCPLVDDLAVSGERASIAGSIMNRALSAL